MTKYKVTVALEIVKYEVVEVEAESVAEAEKEALVISAGDWVADIEEVKDA